MIRTCYRLWGSGTYVDRKALSNHGIRMLEYHRKCYPIPCLFDKPTFKFFTDHKAIVWLRNFKHTNNRLLRWALRLQEYDFEIIYKEGSKNTAADCLSRRSYPPTEQQVMEKNLNASCER